MTDEQRERLESLADELEQASEAAYPTRAVVLPSTAMNVANELRAFAACAESSGELDREALHDRAFRAMEDAWDMDGRARPVDQLKRRAVALVDDLLFEVLADRAEPSDELGYAALDALETLRKIERGEIQKGRRDSRHDAEPGMRRMTIRDAERIAHHATVRLSRVFSRQDEREVRGE